MNVMIDGVKYVPFQERPPHPDRVTMGELLRFYRLRTKRTLESAAFGIGISKSHLWEIEKNRMRISFHLALRLADYYGVELADLAATQELTELKVKEWLSSD